MELIDKRAAREAEIDVLVSNWTRNHTKHEVMQMVSSMRYPQQPGSKYPRPEGVRGWGPYRPG